MGALDRATEDEARGDLGRARERLGSYLCVRGYDAAVLARLGHLCLKMGDLREAGRYFLTSDAEGTDVEAAIEAFVAQHHAHPRQLWIQLPAFARQEVERYPPQAGERLERLGIAAVATVRPRDTPVGPPSTGRAAAVGCLVGFLLILGLSILGFATLIRWLGG